MIRRSSCDVNPATNAHDRLQVGRVISANLFVVIGKVWRLGHFGKADNSKEGLSGKAGTPYLLEIC
jgi:hypothetical protein